MDRQSKNKFQGSSHLQSADDDFRDLRDSQDSQAPSGTVLRGGSIRVRDHCGSPFPTRQEELNPDMSNRQIRPSVDSTYTDSHGGKGPMGSVRDSLVRSAFRVREFEKRTTLKDAPTGQLFFLATEVRELVRHHSVNPDLRNKNDKVYHSLYDGDNDESKRSVITDLIPSMKAELVNFDGLLDDLLAPQLDNHPDPIPEVAPTFVPVPDHLSRRSIFKALAAFPGL